MFASSGANGVLWTTITIAIVVVILAAVTYAMLRPFSHRHYHHQRVPPPHLYHERTDL
jgi:flagellar basal body-associated protein FliL